MKSIRAIVCACGVAAVAAPAAANCPGPGCPSGFVGGILGSTTNGALAPVVRQKQSTKSNATRKSATTSTASTTKAKPKPEGSSKRVERIQTADDLRTQNRAVQEALNRRGFNAGSVDGVVGPRTRAAISAFQTSLGAPVTGTLTPEQEQTLLSGS